MFTGLIEEVGTVASVRPRGDGATLVIKASQVLDGMQIGDSVAISGPCQTVIAFDHSSFTVEAIRETMQRTRFGSLKSGSRVNLERAMRPSDRLGGHMVQGHVDGLVELLDIRTIAGSWRVRLSLPEEGKPFVIEKGSIALDGVSLTVASIAAGFFEVEVIPHTWSHTTLRGLVKGDKVHVEWDVIAKYVNHMLRAYTGASGVDMGKLLAAGFGPR